MARAAVSDTVFVVWPPVWNAFDPHVAVPALCGYLASQNVKVRQFDLNIDFFRHIASEATIDRLCRGRSPGELQRVGRALAFAHSYFEVQRRPLSCGYRQKFSDDAEELLLSSAIEIFNQFQPELQVSTLGAYHSGPAEDSDYLIEFAGRNSGNPYADFYRTGFLPACASESPGVVGISICGSFQLGAGLTLARMIKQLEPRIRVVFGGAFFSSAPEIFENRKTRGNLFRYVDAIVFNEGEIPFLNYIRDVLAGGNGRAPNVCLRGQDAYANEPHLCLNPDQIARPAFADGAIFKYFRGRKRAPVEISRGCYWGRCTFCNLAVGANDRYRSVPTQVVADRISRLQAEYGLRDVIFSTLAMAPTSLRKLASELEANPRDVRWTSWIRPERSWTRDDFERAKRAGCVGLAVTPESFCDTTLGRMRKGVDADTLVRLMERLKEAGLCGAINLIPGFPGETEEDFLSTMDACRSLELHGEFFPFHLLKNSPIYRDPERFGVVLEEQDELDLAMHVSYRHKDRSSESTGVELIRAAAARYPRHISADNPSDGYSFDFRN